MASVRRRVRGARVAALVVALLAAPAAVAETPSLSVRFTWSQEAEVATDLGFAVRLDRAEVMSAGFALVLCAEQSGFARPGILRVGHFSGALPNQIALERAESLIERGAYGIEGFDPPDIDYCQAHFVLGGPKGGFSLKMEGSYRAPGSGTWTRFSVVTPEAYGAFMPILHAGGAAFRGRIGAMHTLEVMRPATGWFDGVDFTSASGVAIGHAVLRRIASATRVTIAR